MKRPLVIIGGGGHCKSVIEAAESVGCQIAGILASQEEVGKTVLGYEIVGTDDMIPEYADKADFIIAIGFIKDPSVRTKTAQKVKDAGGKLATIIASTAHVSRHAEIGSGTVVLHHASVNAGAHIGNNCIINTAANIEHDVAVGNGSHISTGAMVNGDCRIGANVFVGSGAVVANGITVTDGTIVGAGAIVVNDITERGTYIGNPAKSK